MTLVRGDSRATLGAGRAPIVALLIGLIIGAMALPAMAFWTTPGAGTGRSGSATVNAGNKPTVSAFLTTATVNWAASTMSNGAPVSGYVIKAYLLGIPQTVSSGTCAAALVTGTSCSTTGLLVTTWSFTVTPKRGNWVGPESPSSGLLGLAAGALSAPGITSAPDEVTTSTMSRIAFTEPGPGTTLQCQLDGAGFSACASPKQYSGLSPGAHTFQVRAVDAVGQLSGMATQRWTIQPPRPPPMTTFPPAGA